MTRLVGNVVPVLALAVWFSGLQAVGDMQKPQQVVSARLGSTKNVHAYGSTLMCGQPSPEDFVEAKKRGFKIVVTLRQPGEIDWDEAETVRGLGMQFHSIPFGRPDTLTDQVFDEARKILTKSKDKPLLLHCGSANRVGAIWLVHRVLDHELSLEEARQEAQEIGLRTEAFRDKAMNYIQRRQPRK